MRPVRATLIYIGAVFIGGALLAPWLYWLVQGLAAHWPALHSLAEQPFRRYVTRSLMILGVVGLWPFWRSLGIQTWAEAGLCKPQGQGRRLLGGFAVGFVSLAVIAVVALACGGRVLNSKLTADVLVRHIVNAGLAAVFVPILEELCFRGALMGGWRKACDWRWALMGSSIIYALVHFMESPPDPAQVEWTSGLALLPRMMRGFGDVQMLIPGFFNLTLAGVLLGLAYQRTGNLYFSMGLHGGWIFWLKSYGLLTLDAANSNAWLWGSRKLIDGWLALVVLVIVAIPFDKFLPRETPSKVE